MYNSNFVHILVLIFLFKHVTLFFHPGNCVHSDSKAECFSITHLYKKLTKELLLSKVVGALNSS